MSGKLHDEDYKQFVPTVETAIKEKGKLRLLAKPVEPRLLVDHTTHVVIREDRLETRDQFQFTIERAGVSTIA